MVSNDCSYIHSKLPIVIKNKISDWEILKFKEHDWCDEFGNKSLRFRKGIKTYKQVPYWEQSCEWEDITLNTFFEVSQQKQDFWLYFDYKYMKDIFSENSKLFKGIKWNNLQLHDLFGKDSTLWIGNEGAHTPCHMDTYGCNFVAQIFGRKLWILIPPDETENLSPVRVPYEESSIYSSYNFFTPNNNLLKIKKAYKIILSPGDVLFVPRHWWHYVENLEVAISVNVWVSMDDDHESRIKESLVRYYISNICQDLTEEEAKQLLNPNEFKLMTEPCTFSLIQKCIENFKKFKNESKPSNQRVKEMKNKFINDAVQINPLKIQSYIKKKSKVYTYDPLICQTASHEIDERIQLAKNLINSYCEPKNVTSVKDSLLKHFGFVS